MNKNIFLFFLSVFLFSILFSCTPNEEEFKNLNLTITWERDVSSGEETLDEKNKILFFYNMGEGGDTPGALNLENGSTIWMSSENGYNVVQPFFDDSNVYTMSIVDGSRIITTIDKKNGEIRNQKKISGASPRKGHWTLYNNTLYWGGGDHFVHAYNTQDDADSYKVWGSEDVTADIMGDIVPYNGRLYFVSEVYPYIDDPKPSRLISMLPDGSDVKELEIPADFMGVSANCTQFYKGKLYLNGLYFICVDPETMQVEWTLEDPEKKGLAGYHGFAIADDRIYAGVGGGSEDAFVCIDVNTGKVIWREKIDTSFYGSILYPPQVYEGYIYQPLQSCLLVLNAKNGKYVGRDERIRTGTLAVGLTKVYKDLLIVPAPIKGKMYAVKMDMHTR